MTHSESPEGVPDPFGGEAEDEFPRLERLPRAEWRAALEPLSVRDRYRVAHRVPAELFSDAIVLAAELDAAEVPVHARVVKGATVPRVDIAPPLRSTPRQVSFRITESEHARLERAAGLVGLRPAQLARLLVLRGADGLVREYD